LQINFVILSRKATCYNKATSCYRKIICAVVTIPRPVASMNDYLEMNISNMRHILLFGKPLRAFSTKHNFERIVWLRVMYSGMVITERIGQSACLLPTGDMLVYGRASETERMWVNYEGLSNLSWLKIQSAP
jgi:hypothetical protein